MTIPKNINAEHILKAIQKIDSDGVPERRESTRFNLSYKGKRYPPKYVISIANIYANGEEYSPSLFSGGDETNKFLINLGFRIVENQPDVENAGSNNTWIFQGNPKVFDIDNYVKDHKFIWWSLRQEHFADNIQLNDDVYLWRSDGGKRGTGGIIAKCKIVNLPIERANDSDARNYWHTDDWSKPYLAVKLEVLDVKIDEGSISRMELQEHPLLKELLILRLRQQTNYLLSSEHAAELHKLWDSRTRKINMDIENIIDGEITETEKEQVIKSRIGQSVFKKELLFVEKKCRLCGVSDERFLVASHIKPWIQSNNQERLDVNNGLLLCPNHDALFDKGYITFDDDGMIMISDKLDEITRVFLNINETMHIKMNASQQSYMKWHRENLFK